MTRYTLEKYPPAHLLVFYSSHRSGKGYDCFFLGKIRIVRRYFEKGDETGFVPSLCPNTVFYHLYEQISALVRQWTGPPGFIVIRLT